MTIEGWAKLITAIGALLSAIAWPIVAGGLIVVFRREFRSIIGKMPNFVDRLSKLKFAGIETELKEIAIETVMTPEGASGIITGRQLTLAKKIEDESDEHQKYRILQQLDRLCIDYDTIRRVLPSGAKRTQQLTSLLVQMRALGPSVSDHIKTYISSGSAGSRLAAIAMMQMRPDLADLDWLSERFAMENPFVFYHAALALQNAATDQDLGTVQRVRSIAERGLMTIRSFSGEPDRDTAYVLEALIRKEPSKLHV